MAGEEDFIKADRRVRNFLRHCISRECTPEEAQNGLTDVVAVLRLAYPKLNCRLLDHTIWKYDRERAHAPQYW